MKKIILAQAAILLMSVNTAWSFGLFDAVEAAGGALNIATASKQYNQLDSMMENMGLLEKFDQVYVDVTSMDEKKAALFTEALTKEWSEIRIQLDSHNEKTPELIAFNGDITSFKSDSSKVALIRMLPRKSDGFLDVVTDLNLEHAEMVVLDMNNKGSLITQQTVELSDGLFDSWEDKTKNIRSNILAYLWNPQHRNK